MNLCTIPHQVVWNYHIINERWNKNVWGKQKAMATVVNNSFSHWHFCWTNENMWHSDVPHLEVQLIITQYLQQPLRHHRNYNSYAVTLMAFAWLMWLFFFFYTLLTEIWLFNVFVCERLTLRRRRKVSAPPVTPNCEESRSKARVC